MQPSMTMLVAAHKEAPMPRDDFYVPIHVGKALSSATFDAIGDDTGTNISIKNPSYCELTAHYWAWKNLSSDYVGLSHYRRYFRGSMPGPRGKGILSLEEARGLVTQHDVILAKPRNYLVETIKSHYANSHYVEDLSVTREAIQSYAPASLQSYDAVLAGRAMSLYNMFLMPRDEFNAYSEWLFTILGECEKHIDNDSRSAYEQRTFGYLSEILLNVWVQQHHSAAKVALIPAVNTEGEPKLKKGLAMIQRKLTGHTPDEM